MRRAQLAGQDDADSDQPEQRAPIFSFRKIAARPSAISGAMKVSAIASASGTRTIPQKKAIAITAITALRTARIASTRRAGRRGRPKAKSGVMIATPATSRQNSAA